MIILQHGCTRFPTRRASREQGEQAENRALVRRLIEIVNSRDFEAIEEVAGGQIAAMARQWIGPFLASFPDFHMEVVDVIAEADKVVGYFRCSGTHLGEWRGIPPSGRRFEGVNEIYIFAIEDGKLFSAIVIVEDDLTRMQQLGCSTGCFSSSNRYHGNSQLM